MLCHSHISSNISKEISRAWSRSELLFIYSLAIRLCLLGDTSPFMYLDELLCSEVLDWTDHRCSSATSVQGVAVSDKRI